MHILHLSTSSEAPHIYVYPAATTSPLTTPEMLSDPVEQPRRRRSRRRSSGSHPDVVYTPADTHYYSQPPASSFSKGPAKYAWSSFPTFTNASHQPGYHHRSTASPPPPIPGSFADHFQRRFPTVSHHRGQPTHPQSYPSQSRYRRTPVVSVSVPPPPTQPVQFVVPEPVYAYITPARRERERTDEWGGGGPESIYYLGTPGSRPLFMKKEGSRFRRKRRRGDDERVVVEEDVERDMGGGKVRRRREFWRVWG